MPYIDPNLRPKYDYIINQIEKIETKGDLEYLVTKLMKKFMKTREYRYSTLHDCVYAVIHTGEEFKRRYLDKREDKAIEENGDID